MRKAIRFRLSVLFGFAVAVVLMALLCIRHPEVVSSLGATLATARPWGLLAVLISTLVHCAITAYKWRLVTEAGGAVTGIERGSYTGYTTWIALASQFMPQQVAVVAGRGLVLRLRAKVPVRRGALGALYDQGFDLLFAALALPAGLLYFLGVLDPGPALAVFAGGVVGFGVLLSVFGRRLGDGMLAATANVAPARMAQRVEDLRASIPRYLSRAFVLRLYGWSLVRFFNLVFRAWLVAWAIGLEISPVTLLFGHAAISFAALLNFVPGSLGVAEWGWVSLLDLAGLNAGDAARFALSHRILVVIALVMLSIVFAVCVAASQWRARRGVRNEA